MIKVSDYIAKFIAEQKNLSNNIFMVSGGGNMHILDSIGKNKELSYICNHHEQACTVAAESYARTSDKIGISVVTTGPGGTNAVTGVYGAWVDSIPTLTISGQVKFVTTIASQPELNLRQLGDQEVNIIGIVKSITKYAVMITDKNKIKYHLQKAVYEATNKRPGPVWIDIPLDIQGAIVNENDLIEFTPLNEEKYDNKINEVISLLSKAKRPVILAGNGIQLSNSKNLFLNLIKLLKIPVLHSLARYDILKEENPYYFGRYGTIGHRASNFIVQNSDLVIAVGARLNIRAISYNWEYFAREAKIIVVDIDNNELNKHTLNIDLKINSDLRIFLKDFYNSVKNINTNTHSDWLKKCKEYRNKYPTITKERQVVKNFVDSYNFFDVLSKTAKDNTIFVLGNGTASVSSYQSLKVSKNQKVVVNSGSASMGYALPASIGAYYANPQSEIICVTGEGSLQMNIQELQTIIYNKLPIKLFIFNNDGYISIRNTQNNFFGGLKVGSDKESGVGFPDILKIATAYGFKNRRIENQDNLKDNLQTVLNEDGSFICEVMLNPNEKMEPKLSSEIKPDGTIISKPLEDMFPFLDRDEFNENMIVETIRN